MNLMKLANFPFKTTRISLLRPYLLCSYLFSTLSVIFLFSRQKLDPSFAFPVCRDFR